MNTIVASPELAKQLAAATDTVNIVDDNGTVLAVCTPISFRHSPYTREEVEERRREARDNPGSGRKLADFWKEFLATRRETP